MSWENSMELCVQTRYIFVVKEENTYIDNPLKEKSMVAEESNWNVRTRQITRFDVNLIKTGWKLRKLLRFKDSEIAFMGFTILNI